MNVKKAVNLATQYVTALFQQEQLSNIGLEEVTFNEDEKARKITIGFSRPWDYPKPGLV